MQRRWTASSQDWRKKGSQRWVCSWTSVHWTCRPSQRSGAASLQVSSQQIIMYHYVPRGSFFGSCWKKRTVVWGPAGNYPLNHGVCVCCSFHIRLTRKSCSRPAITSCWSRRRQATAGRAPTSRNAARCTASRTEPCGAHSASGRKHAIVSRNIGLMTPTDSSIPRVKIHLRDTSEDVHMI